MQEGDALSWICVYSAPRREAIAVANVMKEGYEVYFPTYLREIKHARRKSLEVRPLFPRYFFARSADVGLPLQAVRRVSGVISLVGGLYPTRVPDGIISYLRSAEGDDHHIRFGSDRFSNGDRIQIMEGPFAGFEGVFMEASDMRRALILITFLGGPQLVKIPAHGLQKKV